jgi:hypothetical protein
LYIEGCMSVDGNPLVSPPQEIVEQGMDAVRRYWREQEEMQQKTVRQVTITVASGVGLLTLLFLGFRFKQRSGRKKKNS